jgi:YVTN family beta-propeller protein
MTFLSRLRAGASALVLMSLAAPLSAESLYTPVAKDFSPMVRAEAAQPGAPVYAGSKVVINGERLVPGQEITLMRGTTVLNAQGPIVVDAEGRFSFEMTLDAEAATGQQPVVLLAEKPAAAQVVTVKVSPKLALSGAERYDITSGPVANGLYQVIHNEKTGAVYVTSAVGRPPVKVSEVTRLDAGSLKVTGSVTPPEAPASARPGPDGAAADPGLFAVYGIDIDAEHDRIWVTNTRQDSIAVYDAKEMALVKQFEPGSVSHGRDVVVDETRGRAYIAATRTNRIEVFDTKTLEKLAPIEITTSRRGGQWSSMALDLDEASGTLLNVSMSSNEVAVIDLNAGRVKVLPLPGALAASGVAYDPQEKLIFVVSQQSDNLLIVSAEDGTVLHDVPVGAQPLNVTFEPVSRQAFVANRGSGTITVVNTKGEVTANLDAGSRPNQLRADGQGTVWAVNKSLGQDDDRGNMIWRIRPAK